MPIINGKVVRARYNSLKLQELSSVDRPAQPGALAMIMKRDGTPDRAEIMAEIAKYICADDGAHTFTETLRENKFSEQIWPFTDALSQSIRSIVGDDALSAAERDSKVTVSVSEFLAAIRQISPETEKRLAAVLNRSDKIMSKTVEQLEAELAKANAANETLTSQLATATKALTEAEAERDKMKTDCDEAKKALIAATDEVITVGGTELRKSAVGDANFTVAKALRDERDMAVFEKRAADEFPQLTGSTAEKALVLKAIDTLPEETKKAADAILTSAQKMLAAGFDRFSRNPGMLEPTNKQAVDGFTEKVAEIVKRDNVAEHVAMGKARVEHPELFAAYQGEGSAAVN